MNINHHGSMAETMKDFRERIERINRAQHGGTPVDISAACRQIVERLRKLEAAYRASPPPVTNHDADEVVMDPATRPMLGMLEKVMIHDLKEKPVEAPPPKRKPGRPRKHPAPAEPGGVA